MYQRIKFIITVTALCVHCHAITNKIKTHSVVLRSCEHYFLQIHITVINIYSKMNSPKKAGNIVDQVIRTT